jgi:DNA-binding NtrC family response regulator
LNRTILLVDAEADVLALVGRHFERQGWRVQRAADAAGAMALYDQEPPDVTLLDIGTSGISGLQLLELLRARDSDAAVIMLTRHADSATAIEAMRLGAENFLLKPMELAHVEAAVERAWEKAALRRRARFLLERQAPGTAAAALGQSALMLELARQVELLAGSGTTVLLTGETGTGKGYVAQLLHSLSPRSAGPFVEVNCAGLSPTFLGSEIFGHEKGAFADAREQKRGLLEIAHTGTVFLDGIGDLATELQPGLLQVIESRRFRRLGGTRELEADVRLVVATHHDLAAAVRDARFREDLFNRLSVTPLRLPPLRDRGPDDIADLAVRLLTGLARAAGRPPASLQPAALQRIMSYGWPGNIRELRNVLERALLLAGRSPEITTAHLPPEIGGAAGVEATAISAELSLADVERLHIARVLAHHAGNRSRAARALGISRATLYEKLARYGLDQLGRSPRPSRPPARS